MKSIREQLYQAQVDAHSAVILHQDKIATHERLLTFVDTLAACVPIAFWGVLVASFQFPGAAFFLNNIVNPLLSALLLIMVIASFVTHARSNLKEHQRYLSEEIIIIRELEELLSQTEITTDASKRLLDWAARVEKEEALLLPKISEKKRRECYRAALRKLNDVHVVCPVCGASPYQYQKPQKEMCQLCGNAPVK